MQYTMGYYDTPTGRRELYLTPLPSDDDELALIDVVADTIGADADSRVVLRFIHDLDEAAYLADEYLAAAAERGAPGPVDDRPPRPRSSHPFAH